MPIISLRNVEKSYKTGAGETFVLRRISLDIEMGEFGRASCRERV